VVVEDLPSKHKILSLNPSTEEEEKEEGGEDQHILLTTPLCTYLHFSIPEFGWTFYFKDSSTEHSE
jgi:hypothetical protein